MSAMEPTDALQKIVAQHGLQWVFEQPETVESLLQDYCERRRPEVHFLVSSLREQIPQRLISAETQAQKEAAVGQARAQLQANLGMLPDKASWTVDAWLRILTSNGGEAQKDERFESVENRAGEFMKQTFEKGATIEQVAGLLAERGLAAKPDALPMAKEYWASLSPEQVRAIRETRRKAHPFDRQQAVAVTIGLLGIVFFAYLIWVKIVPVVWFFSKMACTSARSGDYGTALIIVAVFAFFLFLLSFAVRRKK
jgi:hypothetical protein